MATFLKQVLPVKLILPKVLVIECPKNFNIISEKFVNDPDAIPASFPTSAPRVGNSGKALMREIFKFCSDPERKVLVLFSFCKIKIYLGDSFISEVPGVFTVRINYIFKNIFCTLFNY